MPRTRGMLILRWLLALGFIAAGLNHGLSPGFYRPMMPGWLPWHEALIAISGVAEVVGGIGVLLPRWRRAAGRGLVALLVAVFPANVHAAIHGLPGVGDAVLWWRLPVQAVLIAWVWWACLRRQADEPRS